MTKEERRIKEGDRASWVVWGRGRKVNDRVMGTKGTPCAWEHVRLVGWGAGVI